jgi:outer membrane receptor protein involved in Fe transport
MRFTRLQKILLVAGLWAAAVFILSATIPASHGQTITTGALSGVVADSTGGVVPGAKVTVTNAATNTKQVVVTNAIGHYTVNQLVPGAYKVSAVAQNLRSDTLVVTILLGATATGNIVVSPTGSTTVVQVSASALPLVDTQNVALATTLNTQQIEDLPTPGGDVTTVAFTAPGVVVNAGGSYGNFSSDGLPGISNLYVLNGFDNQDPFLNLNNSGSSNLTLGQGELADATVIQNAYNSQYGRAAGAIISYATKSGGNAFHGEAVYDYNGTILNANGWFNNYYSQARPHAVSNEWALNGGGPIVKDKLFFFSDWEGLHYVLPASGPVSLPSPAYEAYTLQNVAKNAPSALSLYETMFNLYNKSESYSTATPFLGGCGSLAGTPVSGGYFDAVPAGQSGTAYPCVLSGYGNANNINKEWLFTQRVDWVVNPNHKIYARFKVDHGSQPTYTSFIDPVFNAVSNQPEYEGQFNDAYSFSPNVINTAVVAANWYTAFFGVNNPAAAQKALPFNGYVNGYDGSGTNSVSGLTSLGAPYYYPQGRNVTQYQIEDDLSWVVGRHSLKFGFNFRRDLITDYDQQIQTVFPILNIDSLNDFAQGQLCSGNSAYCGSNYFQQAFINTNDAHLALYNVGIYAQDDWQASPKLKMTMGVRFDRTGDPSGQGSPFSLYKGSFPNFGDSLTTPLSTLINSRNQYPFSVDPAYFQPRFGVNYQIDDRTVLRGGIGMFADLYPASFLDGAIQNFPNYNLETIYDGNIATAGTGNMYASAALANADVQSGFAKGSITSINTALYNQGVPFAPPNLNAYFSGTFHEPMYVEFSVQLQRQFSKSDGVSLTYAGNRGYNEILQNPYMNASSGAFSSASAPSSTSYWALPSKVTSAFAGLPVAPPDQNFSSVDEYSNNGVSNYNGVTVEYTHIGQGITGHLAYTYSHALDDISNGGVGLNYNNGSALRQLTPTLGPGNLNYSNADYDIRNNLVGDLVYEEPYKAHNQLLNELVGGWLGGAKLYYRSGTPFTINDNPAISAFPTMAGVLLMPEVSTFHLTDTCASNPHGAVSGVCLDSTQYSTGTGFGNLRRNSVYGPHYADVDASLSKKFVQKESMSFELGAQVYNIFNHPNFANPGDAYPGDASDQITSSSFGNISAVVAPPTSPYGSFQSAAVTQRILVVTGKFTF